MQTVLAIFFMLLSKAEACGQSPGFSPGLYTGTESAFGPAGLYLFRSDSTLLFFGQTYEKNYITYNGRWSYSDHQLKYWETPTNIPLEAEPGTVQYQTTKGPSQDSVYYNFTIQDNLGNPVTTIFRVADNLSVTVLNGRFSGAFARKGHNFLHEIVLDGGDRRGGFYTLKVPVELTNNSHTFNITVTNLPDKGAFILVPVQSHIKKAFLVKEISAGKYEYGRAKFYRVKHENEIEDWFDKAIEKNPLFKPTLDKIAREFMQCLVVL